VLIIANSLDQVISEHPKLVGFYGAVPLVVLEETSRRYGHGVLDLDVDYGAPAAKVLPEAYCHIVRNCVDNAVALGDRLSCVVASVGKEKCDAGRFAAWLIRRTLGVTVVETENPGLAMPRPALLSRSEGSLKRRVVRIMRAIAEPLNADEQARAEKARCEPTHGFWGTPPQPIELLDLFPDTTHIFGWTRCVEQGRPDDLTLEMQVDENLPIVFFSQGFCPKASLARYLAEKHRGIHVDTHDTLGAATMAKIEAFIRLCTAGGIR
jgi:hypothetical protein